MNKSKPLSMILFDIFFILGAIISLFSFYVGLDFNVDGSFIIILFATMSFYGLIWFFASIKRSNIAITFVALLILSRVISLILYGNLYMSDIAKISSLLISIIFMLFSIIAATRPSSKEWRRQDHKNIDEVFG